MGDHVGQGKPLGAEQVAPDRGRASCYRLQVTSHWRRSSNGQSQLASVPNRDSASPNLRLAVGTPPNGSLRPQRSLDRSIAPRTALGGVAALKSDVPMRAREEFAKPALQVRYQQGLGPGLASGQVTDAPQP